MRASNVPFTIDVCERRRAHSGRRGPGRAADPAARAEKYLPPGYLPEPGFAALFASGAALVAMLARRRRAQ